MAKNSKKLSVRLTDREQIWGIVYLLVSVFLLPMLLRYLNGLLARPVGNAWFNFIYFSCNFACVLWIFHGFFKRSLSYAGQNVWIFLLAVLLGAVGYFALSKVLGMALNWLFPNYVNLNDASIITMAHSNFLVMFIGTVFLVPVTEEVLHRGLVFGSLYPKSHVAAYLLSAAIFSAVHIVGYVGIYSLPHLLLAFLQYIPAGLALAWAYRFSGSIFAPIVIHATVNAIGLVAMR